MSEQALGSCPWTQVVKVGYPDDTIYYIALVGGNAEIFFLDKELAFNYLLQIAAADTREQIKYTSLVEGEEDVK